ncbi:MAG: hypothetical protein JXI32_02890 [Deltaproteobacteria bacterium]|nr:hypothetical protein [Deltaproteobacteria bacterium]
MIKKMTKVLQNRDFILSLALIIGLFLPGASSWTTHLVLPALALVMTLSTMGIPASLFRSPRSLIIPAFSGIAMSYGVLAVFILGTSALLIQDTKLWNGFIILALMPPAVAVIPFTDLLRGNTSFSLAGTAGGYLGALIVLPLTLYKFLGSSSFILERLIVIAIILIILPLFISRTLPRWKIGQKLASLKGPITNWSFFVVVYTIVGLNHDIFFQEPLRLLPVALIAAASMFVLGLIIEWTGRLFSITPQTTMSLVLLGTIKNYGLAAGIALALFSKESALPAAVSTIFMFIYIIWMDIRKRRSR